MADEKTDRTAEWLQPPPEEEGLRRYVETIRERSWLVILALVLTTAAAALYVVTAQKTYDAEAKLLITPVPAVESVLASLGLILDSNDPTRDVETAAQLVTNIDVARRAQKELNSPDTPEALLARVEAEPVAQSNLIAVTAREDSAEGARDLANAFATSTIVVRTAAFQEEVESRIRQLEAIAAEGGGATVAGELGELEALQGAPTPDFRLASEAQTPDRQASPRPVLSIAGGILAGLVLGIGGAFLSQVLDPRLRREAQLRRRYRLPILARIPRESARRRRPEPLDPKSLSAAGAEAYRTLRATLASDPEGGDGAQVIVVTGPSAGEGKSTTALNLASAMALAGRRVILIEADLRRPSLGRALDLEPPAGGVVSVLIEDSTLKQALAPTPTLGDNLQVLLADYDGATSGGWITELFSIPAAGKLVDDARRLADCVVIDSPPLNEVVDSLPLAKKADDVLIVVRLGLSRLAKIAQLAELLAENDIRPAGFTVVGTARPTRREYHYYGVKGPEGESAGSAP